VAETAAEAVVALVEVAKEINHDTVKPCIISRM